MEVKPKTLRDIYSHPTPITKCLKALKNKASSLEWGSRGREFKSLHPDHEEPRSNSRFLFLEISAHF